MTDHALEKVLLDVEKHVAHLGWDQPARLFALVETADLVAAEPTLAKLLAKDAEAGALSAIEQDDFVTGQDLLEDLSRLQWPSGVFGVALSVERTFVPPEVEDQIPEDPAEAADFVNAHPLRQDIRVIAGVTRAGARHVVARVKDQPGEILSGEEMAPALLNALAATLES